MKLDDRIKEGEKLLNCFDTAFVEENGYKNTFGYFTNCIDCYADLDRCRYGKLTNILDDNTPYHYQVDNDWYYSFFLPEGSVKPEENELFGVDK